jgi:hypothetical protein
MTKMTLYATLQDRGYKCLKQFSGKIFRINLLNNFNSQRTIFQPSIVYIHSLCEK